MTLRRDCKRFDGISSHDSFRARMPVSGKNLPNALVSAPLAVLPVGAGNSGTHERIGISD